MTPPDLLAQRLSQALGSSYTLEGEIGRGGMGVVYRARDERLKRGVAVKVLPPDLAFREEIRVRFLREAETAARLSHPHIVPIHSVGEGPDGLVYFVMAYVDGESLAARLKRRERLPPEEARRIMMETADALGAGHALGIIHRDVKPDNILLEGSRGRTVLTDFGIAKALTSTTGPGTLTATGVAIGTPHYMSPEQAAGDREIDGRSDIYSLGVVGYQMLAGELPFSAPTVPGLLLKQITEQAPNLQDKTPTCPDDLASCVMRSLEKEPEARWPTADALRRALESRSAPPYRPSRRTSGGAAGRGETRLGGGGGGGAGVGGPPARLSGGGRPSERRRASRPTKKDPKSDLTPAGEPKMVAKFRDGFVSWASVCGGLMLIDMIQGGGL
ncbi:MAG TPA: serine/threonine-protein kinase, partial [Gemmatimonadales bacterium]|nr:serine/threonine-protein kinase [Gemmatimonadales bacterium]